MDVINNDHDLADSLLQNSEDNKCGESADVFPDDISKSVTINIPNKKKKRHSSLSASVEKIAPVFRRSNSISLLKPYQSKQRDHGNYSQSYPTHSCLQASPEGYGSIGSININGEGCQQYQQINSETAKSNDDSAYTVNNEDLPENKEKLICGYTKRQFKVFISLVLLSLNDIVGYSAIAPFYPVVAADKGLTAMQVGLIFSSFSISGIVASLVIGIVLVRVGAKFCVLAGMFWNAGSLICFGFLDQMAPTPFFVLSIASRSLMGFGSNTAFTAMFAIVFQEFNDRAITVLSLSEALVGVGGMVGPLIGGALYQAGGYVTPFMVLGAIQVLLLIMCWKFLPHVPVENSSASVWPVYLLRHSSASIAFLIIVAVFTVNSFITANMSEYLFDEFQLDPVMIGVVFLVSSVFYAGMTPIWGFVADKWRNSYLMEAGMTGMAVGMALVGPVKFLKTLLRWSHQKLWLLFIAAIVNGSFCGAALMPTYNEMLLAANELKLRESVLAQYGLVSGLWNMAFSVGDIAGPTLGGFLVESISFQGACDACSLLCLALLGLRLLQRLWRHCTRKSRRDSDGEDSENDERKPLMDHSTPATQ